MANIVPLGGSGSHGAYQWLTTEHHDLTSLLRKCPQVLIGRYIAITSIDSGTLKLTEEEETAGWRSRDEIAYSPRFQSQETLPYNLCAGYDEWYISETPLELGRLSSGNVFESTGLTDEVFAFANYPHFRLHESVVEAFNGPFWRQVDWIQPESYIADGTELLTFVSRNEGLFAAVRQALTDFIPGA